MSRKEEVRALTRPDPFLVSATKVPEWLKQHQSALLIVTIGGLVVAGGLTMALNYRDNRTAEASALLAAAQEVYGQAPQAANQSMTDGEPAKGEQASDEKKFKTQDEWQAATNEKFTAIVDQHPSSGAARLSRLYLGSLAMDKGEFAAAEKQFRAFLQESGEKHELGFVGALGLAAALEDQGKLDDAAKEYQKLVPAAGAKAPGPGGEEALFALGRIAEKQGKPVEARSSYERLTKDFPQSLMRFKAQARLQTLPKP